MSRSNRPRICVVKDWTARSRQAVKIGLVPDHGRQRRGHTRPIVAAELNADFVVVSIFVNPTQFGAGEDSAGIRGHRG